MSAELEGVGLCAIDVPRFARLWARFESRLALRVFAPAEVAYARANRWPAEPLGARLAAKLALRAALRQAGRELPALVQVEVVRGTRGEPALIWPGSRDGVRVSLSHERGWAIASVVLQAG